MGRIHTLRGTISASRAVPIQFPHLIFDYASADQTRAWKVVDICFIQTTPLHAAPVLQKGSKQVHAFQLATDTGFDDSVLDASENRTFAWETISCENGGDAAPEVATPIFHLKCVDPDHLITDQLYLNYAAFTSAAENGIVWEWSYMIRLEAKKISSSESILQAIKGKGQEV